MLAMKVTVIHHLKKKSYVLVYKYFSKEKFVKIKDIIFFLPERLNKTL